MQQRQFKQVIREKLFQRSTSPVRLFRQLDTHNDGVLSIDEVQECFASTMQLSLTKDQAREVLTECGGDSGAELVTLEQFVKTYELRV